MYRLATKMHELRNDRLTEQLLSECGNDLAKALTVGKAVGRTGIGATRAPATSIKYQPSGPVIQIRY